MVERLTDSKPTVAVVVPNLNQGSYLEEALVSIISQDGIDIYLAVLDAGSSDNSRSIINKYEKYIHYWRSHQDDGQAAAINEGVFNLPKTDYVCWLNADDVFMEHGLSDMVQFLEKHKNLVMVYAQAYITDMNNTIIQSYPTEDFSISALSNNCIICQPATLIRREVWEKVEGVNPSFHMCMDYDLWWRISEQGKLGYLRKYTAFSRDHKNTKTRNNQELHFSEAFNLLKKYLGYVPWGWVKSYAIMIFSKEGREKGILSKIQINFFALKLFLKYRFNNYN